MTNRQGDGAELWRDYNQRACIEQHIEELKNDLQADGFCMREFYATESAFLAVCFTYQDCLCPSLGLRVPLGVDYLESFLFLNDHRREARR